jgi:hypothetical protein
MKRVVGEENFPHKRAGEEGVRSPERIQDKTRAGGFSTSERLLTNSHNRCNSRSDLSMWSYFDGPALNVAYMPFDIAVVGLEPNVL